MTWFTLESENFRPVKQEADVVVTCSIQQIDDRDDLAAETRQHIEDIQEACESHLPET